MDQQSYQVTQQIEGKNHQIAGRDIVNYWNIEPNQPKLLSLCTIEELRAQRDLSKEIIRIANAKISASLPAKILKVTLPAWMILAAILFSWGGPEFLINLYFGRSVHWYFLALILGIVFPGLALYKLAKRESTVIKFEKQRLNNIYYILRSRKIDEI
ncbi:hypothetical protein L1D32_01230 [Shewanella insulae]|uniref:hypothetical protein n=1 Tax=Shewanella insulae TaxID=2681496 RepID=UPI001EFD437C|nr:hypothetical protein [Shewanella insulae]MCG9736782.1 hypothetical protein [Shewanella insulae]